MFNTLLNFFRKSVAVSFLEDEENRNKKFKKLRLSVFSSITIGYSLFYVCRLSINVVKSSIISEGLLNESELGIVGSALFFSYAAGRFTNGFLADRSNIKRFMSTGLFVSAIINLFFGFTSVFIVFAILWGFNGWFQSMGAAPSVVGLSRWFKNNERGTYYGVWSTSHSVGKAITYILISFIVSLFGWRFGFAGAAIIGFIGVIILLKFLYDTPESEGLFPVTEIQSCENETAGKSKSVSTLQLGVLKNPYVWILAFASAFMYISRYAIESWGIFYLETSKGYSNLEASSLLSISAITGIISTMLCGYISDKYFKGSRNIPALFFGLLNVLSLWLFLFLPNSNNLIDIISIALFGFATGSLITYLGGLMAIDIVSKKVSGAAIGVVGIASYIGAGLQDAISGNLIGKYHVVFNGVSSYDFTYVKYFWLGAAALSLVLTLFVWNAKVEE